MNPTHFYVKNEWLEIPLDGDSIVQVLKGPIFLTYGSVPVSDRDAFIITDAASVRGITKIYVKTAANNRVNSEIVVGDTVERVLG